jgi:nicotinate-nucleotide pyrophosphorylase (carboxylating)
MNLDTLLKAALDEDIGSGDLTTESCVPTELSGSAVIIAKEDVIVAGQDVAARVFRLVGERYDLDVTAEGLIPDGSPARKDEVITRIEGAQLVILIGERVALNLLMKLSGIATHTRAYVDAAGEDGPMVVDTRKTTPLLRSLEKYAVRCGGGMNHRFCLDDGVMVKDNHIAAVGSLTEAVRRARAKAHHLVRVEVEVTSTEQLVEALQTSADVIMLDNMSDEQLSDCVDLARATRPSIILEASGNMTPERIERIRGLKLDVVSAGGLIHQARWVDLSLKFQ